MMQRENNLRILFKRFKHENKLKKPYTGVKNV